MSMYPNSQARKIELEYGTDDRAVFNFFNAVYAWMAVGLAVTAVVGLLCSQNRTILSTIYANRFIPLVILGGAFALSMGIRAVAMNVSAGAGIGLFLLYSAVMGALFSGIFVVYPTTTLVAAFFLTAGLFGVLSVVGFIVKKDLTGMGGILIMCAWALFAGSIVNMFIASTMIDWILTYAILAVFIGLTVYDTQKLKNIAYQVQGNPNLASRLAVVGSLELYVDFLNMFLSILRILGSRK
jgi:FtsH-binding integral membrane protein